MLDVSLKKNCKLASCFVLHALFCVAGSSSFAEGVDTAEISARILLAQTAASTFDASGFSFFFFIFFPFFPFFSFFCLGFFFLRFHPEFKFSFRNLGSVLDELGRSNSSVLFPSVLLRSPVLGRGIPGRGGRVPCGIFLEMV